MAEESKAKTSEPVAPADDQVVVPPPKSGSNSSNKVLFIVLGVVAILIIIPIIALASLGILFKHAADKITTNGIESTVKSSTGGAVDVNSDKGTVTLKDNNGNSFTSSTNDAKVPSDFPSQVPQFSPATVKESSTSTTDGKKGWYMTTETSSSYDSVSSFFKDKLAASSWSNMANYDSNGNGTISATNSAAGIEVLVTYTTESGKVDISYAVTQQ